MKRDEELESTLQPQLNKIPVLIDAAYSAFQEAQREIDEITRRVPVMLLNNALEGVPTMEEISDIRARRAELEQLMVDKTMVIEGLRTLERQLNVRMNQVGRIRDFRKKYLRCKESYLRAPGLSPRAELLTAAERADETADLERFHQALDFIGFLAEFSQHPSRAMLESHNLKAYERAKAEYILSGHDPWWRVFVETFARAIGQQADCESFFAGLREGVQHGMG